MASRGTSGCDREVRLPAESTYDARAPVPSPARNGARRPRAARPSARATRLVDRGARPTGLRTSRDRRRRRDRLGRPGSTTMIRRWRLNWLGEQSSARSADRGADDGAGATPDPHRADLAGRSRELDVPDDGDRLLPADHHRPASRSTLLDGGNAASVSSTGVVTALPVGVGELRLDRRAHDPLVCPTRRAPSCPAGRGRRSRRGTTSATAVAASPGTAGPARPCRPRLRRDGDRGSPGATTCGRHAGVAEQVRARGISSPR